MEQELELDQEVSEQAAVELAALLALVGVEEAAAAAVEAMLDTQHHMEFQLPQW